MLERAIKIRIPVDNLVQLPQLRKMGLTKYQLSDDEWKIMEDLYPLLDVSCLFFSNVVYCQSFVDAHHLSLAAVPGCNTAHLPRANPSDPRCHPDHGYTHCGARRVP